MSNNFDLFNNVDIGSDVLFSGVVYFCGRKQQLCKAGPVKSFDYKVENGKFTISTSLSEGWKGEEKECWKEG